MNERSLRARVARLTKVATMPRTVTIVASMIDDGSASAVAISREVSKDQVLTLKLLRLVNSGFCGFRSPVTSISHATVLVGLDALRMLLFGTTLLTLEATQRMKGFWQHSVGTARVAGVLAERAGLAKPEELAVAGLLHDIGKVVITQVAPDETSAIEQLVEQTGGLRIDAEREVLGVTHPEVGGWLAESWSLPERLTYPVIFHNDFDPDQQFADRTAIVHVADITCRARGFGFPGDRRIPVMDRRAWDMLGLSMPDVAAALVELDALDMTGAMA